MNAELSWGGIVHFTQEDTVITIIMGLQFSVSDILSDWFRTDGLHLIYQDELSTTHLDSVCDSGNGKRGLT